MINQLPSASNKQGNTLYLLDDALSKNQKFKDLREGWYQGYGYESQSESDMALCRLLADHCQGNTLMIDLLFRKSELYREKWDKVHSANGQTYGDKTINKALETYNKPHSKKIKTETFPCSDLGNAERLSHHYKDQLRYCHVWKKWMFWDGTKWSEDNSGKINQSAKKTVRKIYNEAKNSEDDNQLQAIAKHAISSESNPRIKSMISLAKSEMPVQPENFDNDPFLLNCKNGILDFRTGNLSDHDREKYITKLAPVYFDDTATCPRWEKFLDRIMDGNQNLIKFLQRAVGYSLTGNVSEQCLFMFWGSGANGKSTFLRTIGTLLGDYSQNTATETLLIKKSGSIPNDIARMQGSRFVTATESEAGHKLAENLIKQMTGDDMISARFLHQEWFDFKPEYKIFLGSNNYLFTLP